MSASDPMPDQDAHWIVLFDAVGTVIYPQLSVFETYFEFGAKFGSQLNSDEIQSRFQSARQSVFAKGVVDSNGETGFPSNDAIEKQLWFDLVQQVFDDVNDIESLFDSLWSFYAQPGHWRVYDDVSECFAAISKTGAKIGLASNFDSRLSSIVRSSPELKQLDWVFYSSMVGYRKPDPRFFQAIASQIQRIKKFEASPRYLMVGDHLENDVNAPSEIGWSSILLDRHDVRHDTDLGDVSIHSLSELPRWFGLSVIGRLNLVASTTSSRMPLSALPRMVSDSP